jgi:hypothetical protein
MNFGGDDEMGWGLWVKQSFDLWKRIQNRKVKR